MIFARALSLLVLCGYVWAAYRFGVLVLMLKIALPLLLALACVWFPDAFGSFSGVIHYRAITTPTPAVLVSLVGWMVLIGVPLIVWLSASSVATP